MDEKTTQKVAQLSAIELTPDEIGVFTPQLGQIVKFFDRLSEVQVDGVEPLMRPFDEAHELRADRVEPVSKNDKGQSRILDSAAEIEDDGFKVPPIL